MKNTDCRVKLLIRCLILIFTSLLPAIGLGSLIKPSPYLLYEDAPYENVSSTQSINKNKKPEVSSVISESADWLINKRNEWSGMIGDTGGQLDSFFAGQEVESVNNGSFLRLGFENKFSKQGEISFDPVFRFKLDLPTLKKRLKLVVESNVPEQKTLSETNLEHSLANEERASSTTTGALQLIFDSAQKWKASTSIGVRLKNPPNPFWRTRFKRRWQIGHDWNFSALQSMYYFHNDGWGETTQLIFEKPIHTYFFTSKSEARWQHDERIMELSQVYSIKKKLSKIRAIKYNLGLLAENQPNVNVTDYYVNAIYRRLIYEDWLFYEVTPELLFPRSDNFKPNPSVLFRLEVVFSDF